MLTSRVRAVRGFTRAMSFVAAVLIAVFGLTMIGGSAYADKDKAEKYDFYTLSSNVTAYFSDAAKPGEGEGLSADEGWMTIARNASEGGDLLGYGDNDISSFSGWLASATTGASNTVGYDSLKVSDDGSSSANSVYRGILDYAQYGSLLNSLGLDSTSTGLGLHFQNMAFGSIMALLYLLAGGIDTIFSAVIWLLETLNPFKLFFSAISVSSAAMANGMTGGQGVPVWMQSLDTWFSGWYQALVNLSWTVLVPLFIFTFIISSLMWKKGNALNGLKKLVIRMLFLGVGLPLIGSMYTASLGVMKDATAGAGMGATRVVLSTFVDFENWAKVNRLAVPSDATLEWDDSKRAPTGASVNKLRQTTVAINKIANPGAFPNDVSGLNPSDLGSISAESAKADVTSNGGLKDLTFMATMHMLLRYTNAQSYQASDFDTAIKGRISQQASGGQETVKNCATTWFNVQADGSTKTDGKSCSTIKASDNPVLKVQESTGLQTERPEGSGVVTFTTNNAQLAGDWVMLGDNFNNANLSALSMYNYLNTAFSKNSATVYSSAHSVSSATREYHNSVNLVGSAGVSWLYWTNSAVTLLCFIVLGLGYAFGMFTGAIKNSLHIITAVPFATLGSLAGIAKVLIYTFTMITEIIATMFIYRLVQEIIISIPGIFEGGLEHMFNSMGGFGTYLKNSGNVTLFTSIVSTVLLLILTWKMLHFRGAFVKGLNEAVTKIVDKFLDTNVAPPAGGGKLMPALAGGVGAGVGSAAANRLMSGRGGLGSGSGRGGASSGLMAGSGGIQDGNGGVSGMGGGSILSINGTDGPDPDEIGPGASGGDPSAPGGGGGGLLLSDGSGGVNVDNSTSNDNSSALMTSESDRQLASEVDARGGLSEPAQLEAGPQADAAASSKVANNADDAMSETAGSIQSTMDAHNKADKARVDQATSGVKAVWHGGKAAAKAYSGDVAGAAQDGQKALGDVQSAQTKGQEAKAHRQSAEAPRPVQPTRQNQPQSQPQRGAVGTQRQQVRQPQAQPQQQAPTQTQAPAQTPAPSRPAPSRGGSSRSLSAPRQGASQMPSSGKAVNGGAKSASGKAGKGLKGVKPSGGSSMPPMPS